MSTGDRTHRVVAGALADAIRSHGPITSALVPSATKRVVAQLRAAGDGQVFLGDVTVDATVEAVQKRYAKLKHGHAIVVRQLAESQRRYAELRDAALRPQVPV